jgi:hypothetical protein
MYLYDNTNKKTKETLFGITHQTMNNYISGRTPIKPLIVRKLKRLGITTKAIRSPSELV